MNNLENGGKAKVISLNNRRLKKKYAKIFNLMNKICGFFCKNTKKHKDNKDAYKKTINH